MKSNGPPPAGGFGYPNPPGAEEPGPPPKPRGWLPGRACGPTPLFLLCALGLVRLCAVGSARAPSTPCPYVDPAADGTFELEAPMVESDVDDDGRDWVAVDDARVYVGDARARAITARPKSGGAKTTLAELAGPLTAMAATPGGVTYATADEDGHGGAVYRLGANGEARALATGVRSPERLAVAGGAVYASVSRLALWDPTEEDDLPATGQILRIGEAGGEPVLARGATEPLGLALDAEDVYFADHARGEILAAPRAGGAARVVADGLDDPRDVAVDDDAVYWTNRSTGDVMRAEKRPGAEPVAIAEGRARPGALVVSGAWVYWVDDAAPAGALIVRMEKRGGEPSVLAAGRIAPANLVVDGGRLVWSEAGVARWVSATATPSPGETLPLHTFDEQPIAE